MKFLYISHSTEDQGGAEISLKTLANQLKKNNHEVIYCSLGKYKNFKTYLFKPFKPWYSYEIYEIYLSNFIRRIIKKEKPDIIHANDRFAIIPSIVAAKKENKPIITHFRDYSLITTLGLPYSPKKGFFKKFGIVEIIKGAKLRRLPWELYKYFYIKRNYKTINSAECKIAVGKVLQKWMNKQGIKNPLLLRNPIYFDYHKNTPSKGEIREKLKIPKRANVVLFLGGFSIGKGIDMVIKLIKNQNKFEKETYFLLVGGGEKEKEIKKLAKKNKKIIYPGRCPHDKIPEMYKASDIVLIPSKYEPFSRIVIESMYMNKPIISSKTGGGQEVIDNGESGFLAHADKMEEWVNVINKFFKCKKKFIQKFRKKFKEQINFFSEEETYKKFIKNYQDVLNDFKNTKQMNTS